LNILNVCERDEKSGTTYYRKLTCDATKFKVSYYTVSGCTGTTVATDSSNRTLTAEGDISCQADGVGSVKRTCGTDLKGAKVLTYAHYSDSNCQTVTDGPNKHAYDYCRKSSQGSKKTVVNAGRMETRMYTSSDCSGPFNNSKSTVSARAPADGSCWDMSNGESSMSGKYQIINLPGTSASTNTASQSSSFAGSILAGALGFIYAVMA